MTHLLRSRRPVAVGTHSDDARANAVSSGSTIVCAASSSKDMKSEDDTNDTPPAPRPIDFSSLPPEIHLAISKHLIYPDALSLKHTNRYHYGLVDTGINLKVAWLVQRRSLHLECPNDVRCDMGSDLRFCRGSVPLLMRRRREHMECDSRPGLGCLVFGTSTCVHRNRRSRWRLWLSTKFTVELWWVLLALVPAFLLSFWLVELFKMPSSVTSPVSGS